MWILCLLLAADPTVADTATDPFLWLENIESPRALEWVEERNRETLTLFEADPRFEKFRKAAESILQDKERIPYGQLHGEYVYNFWQDPDHIRGIWRRTTLAQYQEQEPEWEVLLDIDQLAGEENENWVYKASVPLEPEYRRTMIVLSRGGSDASVWREFDIPTKSFVRDGFVIPQAKTRAAWFGPDSLAVGTDFGEGSLTTSGYPRLVKLWKRGTDLADAKLLFEAEPTDVGIQVTASFRPDAPAKIITRSISFFKSEHFLLGDDDQLTKIPLTPTAELSALFDGAIYFLLREPLQLNSSKKISQGSLVRIPLNNLKDSDTDIEVVFVPNERQSVQQVATGKSVLSLGMLDNVTGQVKQLHDQSWNTVSLPPNGNASIVSADETSDRMFVGFTSFLDPPQLFLFDPKEPEPRLIKSLPERFDASGLVVERHDVKSRDGVEVPYFIVKRKDIKLDGQNPTLLYAYGGFEIPMLPSYSATIGKLWLEQGGVYVLACIRGGGEFGPAWHQAALQKNRQRAYDDFLSVAEDLIASKVTSPRRLGIMGGSNGGLLVGAAFTQRPDLFHAVVCSVPLLDMFRYTKLLAGASWIGEYGDPQDPVMRKVIQAYSPYQNVRPDEKYPRVFFETSTKDDRVHPGHARKMVAKMQQQGHEVYYFENTEGGHSAAANLLQRARRIALEFVYLHRMLMDD